MKLFAGQAFPEKDAEVIGLPSDSFSATCKSLPKYEILHIDGTVAAEFDGRITVCGGYSGEFREFISR